ncbi:MAG: T9SS type A sorting domain-containing protein, partial [Cyclonatronaceae bacterium]
QNYPNPFNPSTNIKYALPEAASVSLVIYDLLGRRVAVLVNEEKTAGWNEMSWNTRGLASGTYFYRLQAGNYTSVKKMMLLK